MRNATYVFLTFFISPLTSLLVACGPLAEEGHGGVEPTEVAQSAAARSVRVGVISPQYEGCPYGDDVTIALQNEHSNNDNDNGGYIGGTIVFDKAYKLPFCGVSSAGFKRPRGDWRQSYAVLQLDSQCPAGSKPVQRYFDMEDYPCGSPGPIITPPPPCGLQRIYGNAAPNRSEGTGNVRMFFCVFEGHDDGSDDPFANLNHGYGVFGAGPTDGDGTSFTGWIRSDDEDEDNRNELVNPEDADLRAILQATRNTYLYFNRIVYRRR